MSAHKLLCLVVAVLHYSGSAPFLITPFSVFYCLPRSAIHTMHKEIIFVCKHLASQKSMAWRLFAIQLVGSISCPCLYGSNLCNCIKKLLPYERLKQGSVLATARGEKNEKSIAIFSPQTTFDCFPCLWNVNVNLMTTKCNRVRRVSHFALFHFILTFM